MVDVSTTNEMVGAVGVLLLGAAGYSLILNADDNSADDLTRRGLRDTLENPNTQRTPPPKPLGPLTECITPEGTALLPLVAEEGEEFTDRWLELVQSAVSQSAVVPTADAEISLQARMEEVRTRAKQRLVLSDALATAVERSFFEQSTMRLLTLEGIAPGATLPYDACTLVKASQFFPGQSARQMRAFVVGSAPSDDPTVNGRFDRLQAARLYVGAIQFGYFISTVFRMPVEAGLTDEQTLNPQEAAALTGRIKEATRKMRSEAAWAVASRRAGLLFGLDPKADADDEVMEKVEGAFDDSSRGYEQLRAFTSQVQVVSAGQQEEFFASDGSRLDRKDEGGDKKEEEVVVESKAGGGSGAAFELPTAEFVPFNALGLQSLLAEGCLFGWNLWGAESGMRGQLEYNGGEGLVEALLPPPVRVVGEGDDM